MHAQEFHDHIYSDSNTTERFHRDVNQALSVTASEWNREEGTRTVEFELPLQVVPSAVKRVIGALLLLLSHPSCRASGPTNASLQCSQQESSNLSWNVCKICGRRAGIWGVV